MIGLLVSRVLAIQRSIWFSGEDERYTLASFEETTELPSVKTIFFIIEATLEFGWKKVITIPFLMRLERSD